MSYTENFLKKSDAIEINAALVVNIYRSIYNARVSRKWPVPTLTSSNELGKMFGVRSSSGTWSGESDSLLRSYEAYVTAFKKLYELSHYGESSSVPQHAAYEKTFPAFNASGRLNTGSEIYASYYNELERYRNDIDSTKGNIGCSTVCSGQSCSADCSNTCVNACNDSNCEASCSNDGTTQCSDCGLSCDSYCSSTQEDGCDTGCTSGCFNGCSTMCHGCSSLNSCGTCSATCKSSCMSGGTSGSYTPYAYACSNSSASTVTSCDSTNCGKATTTGSTKVSLCGTCGGTAAKGTTNYSQTGSGKTDYRNNLPVSKGSEKHDSTGSTPVSSIGTVSPAKALLGYDVGSGTSNACSGCGKYASNGE